MQQIKQLITKLLYKVLIQSITENNFTASNITINVNVIKNYFEIIGRPCSNNEK